MNKWQRTGATDIPLGFETSSQRCAIYQRELHPPTPMRTTARTISYARKTSSPAEIGSTRVSVVDLGLKATQATCTPNKYTKQAKLIKTMSLDVAIIEQTDNAININHGEDVKTLLKELQTDYLTHRAIIPMWQYGDPTNRKRLFIVAFHKRLGPQTQSFQFPKPTFDDHRYPTAANVSVLDNGVPRIYILEGGPISFYTCKKPKPGRIHHLGNYGPGAGDCNHSHPLQSWQGLANTQLTSNGGSGRVMLHWKPGDQHQHTRLITPIETTRLASLPSTYLDWIRSYDKRDATLQRLVTTAYHYAPTPSSIRQ